MLHQYLLIKTLVEKSYVSALLWVKLILMYLGILYYMKHH